MPWSNQNGGGGPWGGGGGNNQGPWGQGPNRPRGGGGGKGGPPDLEDIIRRGQDQLRNIVPGGFNGGVLAIVAVILVAFWLFQCIYIRLRMSCFSAPRLIRCASTGTICLQGKGAPSPCAHALGTFFRRNLPHAQYAGKHQEANLLNDSQRAGNATGPDSSQSLSILLCSVPIIMQLPLFLFHPGWSQPFA